MAAKTRCVRLFPLGSYDEGTLQQQVQLHCELIRGLESDIALQNFAHRYISSRQQFPYQTTFSYHDKSDLLAKMQRFIDQPMHRDIAYNVSLSHTKLVWVFTGMGPQWWGMGRELYHCEPIFKKNIDDIAAIFDQYVTWSLLDEWIYAEKDASKMDQAWLGQVANFALQVGLANLWLYKGIRPDAMIGHSVGELAAFYIAGVYSLEEAVEIAVHRSRLQHRVNGMGKMLAVDLPYDELAEYTESYGNSISIAAINSPQATVLAGETNALQGVVSLLKSRGVVSRYLRVGVPYHSAVMEEIKDELMVSLEGINPRMARLPLYSTVTGTLLEGPEVDRYYWWANIRRTVYFRQAMQAVIEDGYGFFLEIGPHPVLTTAIKDIATQDNRVVHVLSSLHRRGADQAFLYASLEKLCSLGARIDWRAMYSHFQTQN